MIHDKNIDTAKIINYIETEIWEPVPEKRGWVRVTRSKTIKEVYDEAVLFLKQNNLFDELDYFKISDYVNTEFPTWKWIACYAVVGGSEGHYIHVDSLSSKGWQQVFTGKTFNGFEHALTVSNMLSRVFWDELRNMNK